MQCCAKEEKMPNLKFQFHINVEVSTPSEVGRCDETLVGKRRLIVISGGKVEGEGFDGIILPGGVDSQVIRPNGKADISARYALKFNDGTSVYIQNDGIRTVPPEEAKVVLDGGYVDPSHYYFVTVPQFEVYDKSREWMTQKVWVCVGIRKPEAVIIDYYTVEV